MSCFWNLGIKLIIEFYPKKGIKLGEKWKNIFFIIVTLEIRVDYDRLLMCMYKRTWSVCQIQDTPNATYPLFSTAFTAYSTWKTLPSGENWDADKSY